VRCARRLPRSAQDIGRHALLADAGAVPREEQSPDVFWPGSFLPPEGSIALSPCTCSAEWTAQTSCGGSFFMRPAGFEILLRDGAGGKETR